VKDLHPLSELIDVLKPPSADLHLDEDSCDPASELRTRGESGVEGCGERGTMEVGSAKGRKLRLLR
jgi:hypothetical protein